MHVVREVRNKLRHRLHYKKRSSACRYEVNGPSQCLLTGTFPLRVRLDQVSVTSQHRVAAGVRDKLGNLCVFQVLNEVVVDRGPSSYLSNVDLFLDGHLITTVQGDGEWTDRLSRCSAGNIQCDFVL